MRAWLMATTLTVVALSGCLIDDPPADERYGHLAAPGAEITDQGNVRILSWAGEVGPGASAPLLGGLPGSDEAGVQFEADASVGYVSVAATADDPVVVLLRDPDGRIACGTPGGPGSPMPCTAPIDPTAGGGTYNVTIRHGGAGEATAFRLLVELHPPEHVRYGEVHGLSDNLTFHVSDTGIAGGEPTVGVTSDGTIFVVEGTTVLRSQDDGTSWQDVTPDGHELTLDPMLYVDPWTDRVYVNHLYVACSYLAWSDDLGETWVTNPAACGDTAIDHQKLAVGASPLPIAPFFDGTVYFTFNSFALLVDGASHIVASRSLDGGITWSNAIALTEGDLGTYRTGGPVAADQDGHAYIPFYLCDGGFGVTASSDYGVTWTPTRAGGQSGACEGIDPGLAIDTAGNVYGAYWGPTGIRVVASSDHGGSWIDVGPRQGMDADAGPVSAEGLRSSVLVDAIAGDEGRVAVAYLATADSANGPNRAHGWSTWHLYVSVSDDALAALPTWTTTRVTPDDDPVQIGTICTGGIGCFGGNRNLLDFIDIQLTPDGRIVVAYTDGCLDDCQASPLPQTSRDRRGVVAVQRDGPTLFEAGAPWSTAGDDGAAAAVFQIAS